MWTSPAILALSVIYLASSPSPSGADSSISRVGYLFFGRQIDICLLILGVSPAPDSKQRTYLVQWGWSVNDNRQNSALVKSRRRPRDFFRVQFARLPLL